MSDEPETVAEARRLLAQGAYGDVVARLTPYVRQNPMDGLGWGALAAAQYGLGRWQAAEDAARRAVFLRPQDARAWFNWGLALRKVGKLDDALQVQRRALVLDPTNERARAEIAAMEPPWMHKPRSWESPAFFLVVFGAPAAVLGFWLLWHRQWTMVYGEAFVCGAGVTAFYVLVYSLLMGGREAERLLRPRFLDRPKGYWWASLAWIPLYLAWYCSIVLWLGPQFEHLEGGGFSWCIEGLLVGLLSSYMWYRRIWARAWALYHERQAAAQQ